MASNVIEAAATGNGERTLSLMLALQEVSDLQRRAAPLPQRRRAGHLPLSGSVWQIPLAFVQRALLVKTQ